MICAGIRGLMFAFVLLVLGGCTHPVLGRPAIVGASVSCGVGACVPASQAAGATHSAQSGSATASESRELPVNLAIAYAALVQSAHHTPIDLSDPGTFLEPLEVLRGQVNAAIALRPTVVIGVDALFWPVRQPIPLEVPADQRRAMRLEALEQALAELDRVPCAIVIGDLPRIGRPGSLVNSPERSLDDETLAELNARLSAWVLERPNRAIVRLSHFVEAIDRGESIELGGFRVDAEQVHGLLQSDRLHASGEGIILLTAGAIDALEQRGIIESGVAIIEREILLARLEREADTARRRAKPSLLQSLSLAGMHERLQAELKRGDDAAAAATLDAVLTRLAAFDANPLGADDPTIGLALQAARWDAPAAKFPRFDAVWKRQWRALEANAVADRSDPWKLELWLDLGRNLGEPEQLEMIELLGECRERLGRWEGPRGRAVWDFMNMALESPQLLNRVYPDLDEALEFARESAVRSLAIANRVAAYAPPDSEVRLQWAGGLQSVSLARLAATGAGKPYLALMKSADGSVQPERAASVRAFAEAAGHGRVLDAQERRWILDAARRESLEWSSAGVCRIEASCFGAAQSVETADRSQHHARQSLVPVRHLGRHAITLAAEGGFGWLEGMDGAAAIVDGQLVATRVGGSLRGAPGAPGASRAPGETGLLEAVPPTEDLAATFWVEPWKSSNGVPQLQRGSSSSVAFADRAAVEQAIIADMEALDAATKGDDQVAQPSSRSARLPITLRGRISHATVRIPAGVSDESGGIRWVVREIHDAPVIVTGVVGRESECPAWSTLPERASDSAPRRSRFHVIWAENGVRYTGELVEWSDLRCEPERASNAVGGG